MQSVPVLLSLLASGLGQGVPALPTPSAPPATAALPAAANAAGGVSLRAEKWLNGPTLRHPEDRSYVILFFNVHDQDRDTAPVSLKELGRFVGELNKLSLRRPDVLVLGLTAHTEKQIARFMVEFKPRFAIGVQSLSYKRFRVEKFPTVVVIPRRDGDMADPPWSALDSTALDAIPEKLGPPREQADIPLEELSNEELMHRIKENPDPLREIVPILADALELLRTRMDAEDFMRFCDEIEYQIGYTGSIWVGRVRYERHLADPTILEKQPRRTRLSEVLASWRASRDDPTWASFSEFSKANSHDSRKPGRLIDLYRAHMTEDANDLLIRHDLTFPFNTLNDPAFIDDLKGMLDIEPDPILRSRILICIVQCASRDDTELLPYLEGKLAGETNIYWARPTLEMVIDHLRTGVAFEKE